MFSADIKYNFKQNEKSYLSKVKQKLFTHFS